jgi:hypothetical protein
MQGIQQQQGPSTKRRNDRGQDRVIADGLPAWAIAVRLQMSTTVAMAFL